MEDKDYIEESIPSALLNDEDDHENIELQFDEYGNIVDNGDDEDYEEPDGEPETEQIIPEDAIETEVEEKVQSKGIDPKEAKIIELKKQNALLKKQVDEKQTLKEQEELENKFINDGYDKDTAKNMSITEIRIKQLEDSNAILMFEKQNSSTLNQFPEAQANIQTIMKNSKLTGMTVEQICKGLYGNSVATKDQRAINAVKGVDTIETKRDVASTQTTTSNYVGLTQSQVNQKKMLERMFNDNKPLTIEEYNKYK